MSRHHSLRKNLCMVSHALRLQIDMTVKSYIASRELLTNGTKQLEVEHPELSDGGGDMASRRAWGRADLRPLNQQAWRKPFVDELLHDAYIPSIGWTYSETIAIFNRSSHREYWEACTPTRRQIIDEAVCFAAKMKIPLAVFHRAILAFDNYHHDGRHLAENRPTEVNHEIARIQVTLYLTQANHDPSRLGAFDLTAAAQWTQPGTVRDNVTGSALTSLTREMRKYVQDAKHSPTLFDIAQFMAMKTNAPAKSQQAVRLLSTMVVRTGLEYDRSTTDTQIASICVSIACVYAGVDPLSTLCASGTGVHAHNLGRPAVAYSAAITIPGAPADVPSRGDRTYSALCQLVYIGEEFPNCSLEDLRSGVCSIETLEAAFVDCSAYEMK